MNSPMFANLRQTPDRESALRRRFWIAAALAVLISALEFFHGSTRCSMRWRS